MNAECNLGRSLLPDASCGRRNKMAKAVHAQLHLLFSKHSLNIVMQKRQYILCRRTKRKGERFDTHDTFSVLSTRLHRCSTPLKPFWQQSADHLRRQEAWMRV